MPFLLTDLLLLYNLLRDYFVADTWKIFYASPQLIPTTRFFIFKKNYSYITNYILKLHVILKIAYEQALREFVYILPRVTLPL